MDLDAQNAALLSLPVPSCPETEQPATVGGLEAEFDVQARSVLGTGLSGEVRLASRRSDGKKHAVKTLRTVGVPSQRLLEIKSEVDTHMILDHPHIARLDRTFETDAETYLVMEHLEGGEVFDRLQDRQRFSERETADTMRQVLWAVSYLHSLGLTHLDLKLENFLYERQGGEVVKLIDFGFATRVGEDGTKLTRKCGSLYYIAPEVLRGSYDEKADLWSLGVVAYMLLCGTAPWSGSDDSILKMIHAGTPRYSPSRFQPLSEGAKDFVRSLLTFDPTTRPSARSALDHSWLRAGQSELVVSDNLLCDLRAFARPEPFSAAAAVAEATDGFSPEELGRLRSEFRALDRDLDGVISCSDLAYALAASTNHGKGLDVNALFAVLDPNGHGKIAYSEFVCLATQGRIRNESEASCREFSRFDEVTSNSEIAVLQEKLGDTFLAPATDVGLQSSMQHFPEEQMPLPVNPELGAEQEFENCGFSGTHVDALEEPSVGLVESCYLSGFESEEFLCGDTYAERPGAARKCFDIKRLIKSVVVQGQKAKNSFPPLSRRDVRGQRPRKGRNFFACRSFFLTRPQVVQSFLGHPRWAM